MAKPRPGDANSDQSLLTRTDGGTPLSDAEFDDLMGTLGPFEHSPALAVAVSGGPDSLALTLLASRWATSRGGRAIGLTVDHGLRPASAEEARQTGRWLRDRGVEHHTLLWTGPKPATGLQQQARKARYDRLHAWCRQTGILHLLTAHHQQDQAETVALRKARQSGPNGLAGMAAVRGLRDMRLLRPLLGIDKARLIATLDHMGQDWIDDPSNRSLHFTRNRLRHDGIDLARLTDQASRHGRMRRTSDYRLHAALARFVTLDPAGFARAPDSLFSTLPVDLAEGLVTRVLMTIGGGIYPPRSRGLRQLLSAMRDDRPFTGKTLGHCWILRRKGHWLFCRERAPASTLVLTPEHWHHWEHRFLIRSRHRENGLSVRQLGDKGWSRRHHLIERDNMRDVPSAARSSLPSIWQDQTLLAIPHAGLFERSFDPLALDLKFRPLTPLANAPFAAHMCAYSNEKTVAKARC